MFGDVSSGRDWLAWDSRDDGYLPADCVQPRGGQETAPCTLPGPALPIAEHTA